MKAHPEITGVLIGVMYMCEVFINKKGLAEANPLRKEFGLYFIDSIQSNRLIELPSLSFTSLSDGALTLLGSA